MTKLLNLQTAMVYGNAMAERNIFEPLRARLIKGGYSHLKWAPVIAFGYGFGVWVPIAFNRL